MTRPQAVGVLAFTLAVSGPGCGEFSDLPPADRLCREVKVGIRGAALTFGAFTIKILEGALEQNDVQVDICRVNLAVGGEQGPPIPGSIGPAFEVRTSARLQRPPETSVSLRLQGSPELKSAPLALAYAHPRAADWYSRLVRFNAGEYTYDPATFTLSGLLVNLEERTKQDFIVAAAQSCDSNEACVTMKCGNHVCQ